MNAITRSRIWGMAAALLLGFGLFAALYWLRDFPWQFALASAGAAAGLLFVGVVTTQRLRIQLRTLKEPWF